MRSIEEVRAYIRKAARQKLREAINAVHQPPATFSEFRNMLADALSIAGAPDDMTQQVSGELHVSGSIYNMLYDAWCNIESELFDYRQSNELVHMWHDMIEFYVRDAIVNILNLYDGDLELPADEVLNRTISIIKFERK